MQRSRRKSNVKQEYQKKTSKDLKLLRLPTNETHGSKFTAEYFDLSDSQNFKQLSNPRYKHLSTSQSQQFTKYFNTNSNGFSPNIGPLTTQSSFRQSQMAYRNSGQKVQYNITSRKQDSILNDNNSFLSQQPIERKTFYDHKNIYTLKDYKKLPSYEQNYTTEKDDSMKARQQLMSQFRGKITKHMLNIKLKRQKTTDYKKLFQDNKQTSINMDSFLVNDLEQSFLNQNTNAATNIDNNRFNYLKMNNEQSQKSQQFQVKIIFKGDQIIQRKYQHKDLQEFVIKKFEPFLNSNKVQYGDKIERISKEYEKLIAKLQGNVYKIKLPQSYKPKNQNFNDYYKFDRSQLKNQLRNIEFLKSLDIDIFDLITQDGELYRYKKLGELRLYSEQDEEEPKKVEKLIIKQFKEIDSPFKPQKSDREIENISISEEQPKTPSPEKEDLPIVIQNEDGSSTNRRKFKKQKTFKFREQQDTSLNQETERSIEEQKEEEPQTPKIKDYLIQKPQPKQEEEKKEEVINDSKEKIEKFMIQQDFVDKQQETKDLTLKNAPRKKTLSKKSTQQLVNKKTIQVKTQESDQEQEPQKEDSYSMSESEFASNQKPKYKKKTENNEPEQKNIEEEKQDTQNQKQQEDNNDLVFEINAKVNNKIVIEQASPLKRDDQQTKDEIKQDDENKEQPKTEENLQPPKNKKKMQQKRKTKKVDGKKILTSAFINNLLRQDNVFSMDLTDYSKTYTNYPQVPKNIEFPQEQDYMVYDKLLRWQHEVNQDIKDVKNSEFQNTEESEEEIQSITSVEDSDDYEVSIHTSDMHIDDDIKEGRDDLDEF